MKIAGTAQLTLPREQAWDRLQDPDVLAKAIPGCEELIKTGDGEYKLKMKMAMASLSGAFDGNVKLQNLNRPNSYRMVVEGKGKIGWMKGEGLITLADKDQGTEVTWDGDAQVGGTMAAVGQRLIDTSARMMIKRFFERIATNG